MHSGGAYCETTFKVSANCCNAIIGIFNVTCFVVAVLSLFRQIPYEDLLYEGMLVWNGHIATLCYNATVTTSQIPSLLKRFEIEPYTKLAFRFALMFPATCRVFHAFVRYKYFERVTLKGNAGRDGLLLMIIYKLMPVFLCLQILCAATTLVLNGFIDKAALPNLLKNSMMALICFSLLYMATILAIDFRTSKCNLITQILVPRYCVRLLCAIAFSTCIFPTFYNYLYYIEQRQCNILATTTLSAVIEYLTIFGISGFHFSEVFDLDLIHFVILETKEIS